MTSPLAAALFDPRYRGMPKGDLAALARAVAVFSRLAALPCVTEAEVNPLIVLPDGQDVVMADALLACA